MPIKTWEIWNEANYFYFAYPVSPFEYAKLLKLSTPVIKRTEPGAKVILTGLFGRSYRKDVAPVWRATVTGRICAVRSAPTT